MNKLLEVYSLLEKAQSDWADDDTPMGTMLVRVGTATTMLRKYLIDEGGLNLHVHRKG